MVSDARFEEMYRSVRPIAEVHAASTIRAYQLPSSDYQDLVQEGLIAYWQSLARLDPVRGSPRTFGEAVIANRLTSLARSRTAAKRGLRICLSLENIAGEVEPVVHQPDLLLQIEVCRILSRVPAELRRIVLMLADHTPSEASRVLGVARSTVYERIDRLRAAFEHAGLGQARSRGRGT